MLIYIIVSSTFYVCAATTAAAVVVVLCINSFRVLVDLTVTVEVLHMFFLTEK